MMGNKERPHVVGVSLNDEEMAKLRGRANFEGMTMAGYIRHLLRHGRLPLSTPPENLVKDSPRAESS
jgi:hypothetical protein